MNKMKVRSAHKCIVLVVLLFFCRSSNGQVQNAYEGLKIPPIPEGHREVEGFLIDDKPDSYFALARISHQSGEVILLEKLLYHDKEGHPHWEVVSALAEPRQREEHIFFMGTCMMNGKHQRDIIALVQSEDQEIQTEIIRAWRVKIIKQKIEKIPVDGITCYIDGWGHN